MPFVEPVIVNILNRLTRSRRPEKTSDGLLLGASTRSGGTPVSVVVSNERRPEHLVVLGKTGTGKTHLLQVLANQLMSRNEGFGFVDYHGDATEALIRLATHYPAAAERLIVLDPTDQHRSPGLNPLEMQGDDDGERFGRVSELATILRQRWGVDAFGARTEELLRNSLYALAASHLTLVELPALLTSSDFRHSIVFPLVNQHSRSYWLDRFEPLSEPMKAVFREPLLNKVTEFIAIPAVRHVLGQPASTIDFTDAMQQGRWVLIHLPKGILREHSHTLGNLLFAKLQFDIMARSRQPQGQRRLFTIFCDEVQNLGENDLATLLTEGRKFSVSLITGNQFWEQLPRTLRGALLSAGSHVLFRLSAADARTLAPELAVGSRLLAETLPALPRGEAIARVGAEPPQRIRVPPLPRRTNAELRPAALRSLSVHRWSRERGEIEADIRARTHIHDDSSHPIPESESPPDRHEGQREW